MNALLSPVLERPAIERPDAARPPLRRVPTRVASRPVPTPRPGTALLRPRTLDAELRASGDDLRTDPGIADDARLLSAKLALCVVEILAGARPLDQLGRWVSDSVFIHLLRRTVIAARSREVTGDEAKRPRVRVGEPVLNRVGDSVVEAVVMIHQPSRSRAVALRLERHRSRWRATAITVL